jgi:Protein of unknown function (DUF2848)
VKKITVSIDGEPQVNLRMNHLVIASWTGRDREMVHRRVAELKATGIKVPFSTPCFYNVSSALLTTDNTIEVVGRRSTGEVEAVLLQHQKLGLLVGVGSDHTDRKAEINDVALSKQVCPKPISNTFWKFDDVADHWDKLIVRSWRVMANDVRVQYQEGSLASLLPPAILMVARFGLGSLPDGTTLFCGTQPVIGELLWSDVFEMELFDPVREKIIRHSYRVRSLDHIESD